MTEITEEDIVQVVDEIADDANPELIAREAERLGITTKALLARVVVEILERIG